jgi:hypothetical protein
MASNLRFIKKIIDENIPLIICTVSCICEFKTRSGKDVVDFDCQAAGSTFAIIKTYRNIVSYWPRRVIKSVISRSLSIMWYNSVFFVGISLTKTLSQRGLWCITSFSTIIQLYRGVSFIGGGNRSTRIKPTTFRKSQTNFTT